jgi:predicted transcriptional regulator of viral defense system
LIASAQAGYFTLEQARECGFTRSLVHGRPGTFVRVHEGVYRLARYPSPSYGDVIAAWLAVGAEKAVVSHDTALRLYGLSDIADRQIHLTVGRGVRRGHGPDPPAVKIHVPKRPFRPGEILEWEGMRVTAPARTIVDAADAGAAPEVILMAIREGLERGLTSRRELTEAARGRTKVAGLIQRKIKEAEGR